MTRIEAANLLLQYQRAFDESRRLARAAKEVDGLLLEMSIDLASHASHERSRADELLIEILDVMTKPAEVARERCAKLAESAAQAISSGVTDRTIEIVFDLPRRIREGKE